MNVMPQELEVWYLLPALRRELVKVFIKDYNLKQKEASSLLGITEAATSQYLKSKRASELKFTKDDVKKIKEYAEKIVKDRKHVMEYIYNLCHELRGSKSICDLHKKYTKNIPANCDICVEK